MCLIKLICVSKKPLNLICSLYWLLSTMIVRAKVSHLNLSHLNLRGWFPQPRQSFGWSLNCVLEEWAQGVGKVLANFSVLFSYLNVMNRSVACGSLPSLCWFEYNTLSAHIAQVPGGLWWWRAYKAGNSLMLSLLRLPVLGFNYCFLHFQLVISCHSFSCVLRTMWGKIPKDKALKMLLDLRCTIKRSRSDRAN